ASQRLIEHVAGDCPEAWLVARGRFANGQRWTLREESVIGRTKEADISLESARISRRHAEVFANAGAFWIADLCSTNPTFVNGVPLALAPHRLAPGDVIVVGDVELHYEEARRTSSP